MKPQDQTWTRNGKISARRREFANRKVADTYAEQQSEQGRCVVRARSYSFNTDTGERTTLYIVTVRPGSSWQKYAVLRGFGS